MQSKRWFTIIIYIMVLAMLLSTGFVLLEPFLYGGW